MPTKVLPPGPVSRRASRRQLAPIHGASPRMTRSSITRSPSPPRSRNRIRASPRLWHARTRPRKRSSRCLTHGYVAGCCDRGQTSWMRQPSVPCGRSSRAMPPTGRQLVADGATVTPAESWRLPLLGDDTQDFGLTPYYFEPAMTYQGVYYPQFHDGTDIAVAWGTPVLATAPGVVVFAVSMGDGAVRVV